MRQLDRHAGFAADAHRFLDRLGYVRPFVANVACVHALVARGFLRQHKHLFGVRISTGHVDQAGRKAHGAGLHGAGDHFFHPGDLGRRGFAVGFSHRDAADVVVPDQGSYVGSGPGGFEAGKEVGQIGLGVAAVSGDEGGDSVANEVLRERHLLDCAQRAVADLQIDVRVDIDEAGSQHMPAGIDGAGGAGGSEFADGRDLAAGDGDIARDGGAAGTVRDAGVTDQEIVVGGGEREGGDGAQEYEAMERHAGTYRIRLLPSVWVKAAGC